MNIEWKDEVLYKDLVKWGERLQKEAPFFKKLLDKYEAKNTTVLDVSCGTGFHLVMLSKWGFKGFGIDISEQNIVEANKLAIEKGTENRITFILGDMIKIGETFQGNKFDFIYCIGNTLSIFDSVERESIINQLVKLLNPRGKILLQVVNYLAHSDEDSWFYNPNLKRSEDGSLSFHIRFMEWKQKNEKVTMHVHTTQQTSQGSDDFRLLKKQTEFFVPKKEDFRFLNTKNNLKISFYGDYFWNKFDVEKSNDLVVIIKKNN